MHKSSPDQDCECLSGAPTRQFLFFCLLAGFFLFVAGVSTICSYATGPQSRYLTAEERTKSEFVTNAVYIPDSGKYIFVDHTLTSVRIAWIASCLLGILGGGIATAYTFRRLGAKYDLKAVRARSIILAVLYTIGGFVAYICLPRSWHIIWGSPGHIPAITMLTHNLTRPIGWLLMSLAISAFLLAKDMIPRSRFLNVVFAVILACGSALIIAALVLPMLSIMNNVTAQ